jgi:hypothetical protein
LTSGGALGRFADRLLTIELPDLPRPARDDTVAFVCQRASAMPSPLRLGLELVCAGVALAQRAGGVDRTTRLLQDSQLPLLGELARMVRSLGFAYIWETWPDTSPSGDTGGAAAVVDQSVHGAARPHHLPPARALRSPVPARSHPWSVDR